MKRIKLPRILKRMHILCKDLPHNVTDSLYTDSYYKVGLNESFTFKDQRAEEAKAINYKGTIPVTYGISYGDVLLAKKKDGNITDILIAPFLSDEEIKDFIDKGELDVGTRNFEELFIPINLPFFRKSNYKQVIITVAIGVLTLVLSFLLRH